MTDNAMSNVEPMSDADLEAMRRWLTPDGRSPQNVDVIALIARIDTLTAALAAMTSERDALREALAYVRHKNSCAVMNGNGDDCSCGLDKLPRAALTTNHSAPVVEE